MPIKAGPSLLPLPYAWPFLRLSGPFTGYAESPMKRCLTHALTFRLRADAELTVQVQHRTTGAWETMTFQGRDIQQLLKIRGHMVRLIVTGTASGVVDLVSERSRH